MLPMLSPRLRLCRYAADADADDAASMLADAFRFLLSACFLLRRAAFAMLPFSLRH